MSKYDWSNAKKWAKYIATDKDGSIYQFSIKPMKDHECWHLKLHEYNTNTCLPFFDVGIVENWQDSLEERPK